MQTEEELPDDLEQVVASLHFLNDAELWRAARSHLPSEAAVELEELHLKRQYGRLTQAEIERSAELIRQYERAMLVRAEAASLLKQRGYDLAILKAEYEQSVARA
jgi:hypothetical protein